MITRTTFNDGHGKSNAIGVKSLIKINLQTLLLALGTSLKQLSQFVNVFFQFDFYIRVSPLAPASTCRENLTSVYDTEWFNGSSISSKVGRKCFGLAFISGSGQLDLIC